MVAAVCSSWISGYFDKTIQHTFFAGLVERDVEPIVLSGFHGAVTKLLMEHPRADLDRVGAHRASRLLPGFNDSAAARARPTGIALRPPGHQREVATGKRQIGRDARFSPIISGA